MTSPGIAIVIDVAITQLADAPLHALEIWSNPNMVAKRFEATMGFALPAKGRSGGTETVRLIRYEPTVWLVEGETAALPAALGEDGALTAIGGGIVRVRLSGEGWRELLMESGVFNAESPDFCTGCSAATIINHVPVRLHVVADEICDVFIPRSYSTAMIAFWGDVAGDQKT
jgi:heterotetrameric sarcosine oxidase gamma subunit